MSFETSTGHPLDENEINFEASNDVESRMSPDDFADHEISPEQKLSEDPTPELSVELTPISSSEANRSSEPPPEIIEQFGSGEWKRTYNEYSEVSTSTFDFARGEMLDAQGNSLTEEIRANSTPEQIAMHDEIITKWKSGEAAYITYFETVGVETTVNITKTWVEPNGIVASETWSRVYEKKPIELAPPQAVEGDDEGGADDGIFMLKVEAVGGPAPTPSESSTRKENVSFFVEPTALGVAMQEQENVTKTETPTVSPAVQTMAVSQAENVSSLRNEIAAADTTEPSRTFGDTKFAPPPISQPTPEIKIVPAETATTFAAVKALPKMTTEKPAITLIEALVISEVSEPIQIKKKPEKTAEKTTHEILATAPLEIPAEKNIPNPQIIATKIEAGPTETTVVERNAIAIETNQENSSETLVTENIQEISTELVLPITLVETEIDTITDSKIEDSVIARPEKYETLEHETAPFILPENSGITLKIIGEQPENETATIETDFQPNIMRVPEINTVAVSKEIKPPEKTGIEIETIDEPVEIVENTVEPVSSVAETLKKGEPRESTTEIITPEITGVVLDEKIESQIEAVATPPTITIPETAIVNELNHEYQIAEARSQTKTPAKIYEPIPQTAPEKSAIFISEQKISQVKKKVEAQKIIQEIVINKPDIPKVILRPIAAAITPRPRPNIWRAPRPQAESTTVYKNKSTAPAETLVTATSAAPNFIHQERPLALPRVLNVLRPVELVRALTRRRPAQIPDPIEDTRTPARSPLTRYAANS